MEISTVELEISLSENFTFRIWFSAWQTDKPKTGIHVNQCSESLISRCMRSMMVVRASLAIFLSALPNFIP